MHMVMRRCGALVVLLVITACGLLDVSDPTKLEDDELNNGAGAELFRKDAVTALAQAVGQAAFTGGILADEFFWDRNPLFTGTYDLGREALDRRQSVQYEGYTLGGNTAYSLLQEARRSAMGALERVRVYAPEPGRAAYTGQVFALRGYTILLLAEDVCSGFPLNDVVNGEVIFGGPTTTTAAFERALADFDSAVVFAADTARFLSLAQVGRGRTLLGLGRFADAAAAVQSVPNTYAWRAEFAAAELPNPLLFTYSASSSRVSVANDEGGNGLDFVAAADPRVATSALGLAHDGVTSIRAIGKYPTNEASIVFASGIEARLIEAEAALLANSGQPQWLTMLNALRTACQDGGGNWTPGTGGIANLPPLADPGIDAARVDLLFRERAFWLFATGSRLGDLRRLVQHYDRDPGDVFPSGPYRAGGPFGTATSIPFPAATEAAENPAVAAGCISR